MVNGAISNGGQRSRLNSNSRLTLRDLDKETSPKLTITQGKITSHH